jgi:hypothetical protein
MFSVAVPWKFASTEADGQEGLHSLDLAASYLAANESPDDPLFYFSRATFAPYLNTTFRIRQQASRTTKLRLVEVGDVRSKRRKKPARAVSINGGESFSLMFVGSGRVSLQQNTYTVEHDALGNFSLFLVPVGKPEDGLQYYQAIINRVQP